MSEVVRSIRRIYVFRVEADPKTSSSAQPAVFLLPNHSPLLYVTTTAIDNVTDSDEIATEPFRVVGGDTCDAIFNDSVVTDILGHDRRDAMRYIVRGVKLAPERPCLYVATPTVANFAEGCVPPANRKGTE
jgi:hypothetical protein